MVGVQLAILVTVVVFYVKKISRVPSVTGLVGVILAILVTVLAFEALEAPFS